jgi:hypothetical protein
MVRTRPSIAKRDSCQLRNDRFVGVAIVSGDPGGMTDAIVASPHAGGFGRGD